MKKLLLISLSLLCFIEGYTQNEVKVSKRSVEKSTVKSKKGYNYFLLDQIKAADDLYAAFVGEVKFIWNGNSDSDLNELVDQHMQEIEAIRHAVNVTPVYIGGKEYQEAVVDYIEAVRVKLKTLQSYAVLDPHTELEAYNLAMQIFDDATDIAMEKRDALKEVKNVYEKTFYIEK